MNEKLVNSISGRMSIRKPLRESLEILGRVMEICTIGKDADVKENLSAINREYPTVTDFERDFPSLCFALATGVGKTRLMGAFISYLYLSKGIKHYFVLAPNLPIYNKLISDFTPNTPKYVFKGIAEFAQEVPVIVTGDNYESGIGTRNALQFSDGIVINIFNISKINSEVRGGASPRIKRLSEYIGQSYFDYLAGLDDLVLLMDESHRYRASAGIKAINELKPILGLELTATPFTEKSGKLQYFMNVIKDYPLGRAMEDGYVKEPAVVTQKNFNKDQFTKEEIKKIKVQDGIRLHENTKVELETYARQTGKQIVKPFMLIIEEDIENAKNLQKYMESDDFFHGDYKGKVIQVHSAQTGEEKEENVQRLLEVERYDEPTEVVIHVNMLKEGWDVTNLYTIVPLRAANARTLVEQSIGRGLRLPYGTRTGVEAVDQLNIVGHDHFQEIVDEANRSDSPIRLKTVYLDGNSVIYQKQKTVVVTPKFIARLGLTPAGRSGEKTETPMYKDKQKQKVAQTVADIIKNYGYLPFSGSLRDKKVQAEIVADVRNSYIPSEQIELGINEPVKFNAIVEEVIDEYVNNTISIPRIVIVPKQTTGATFSSFKLDCNSIRYQPVERDLLLQQLRTNKQTTLTFDRSESEEERMENYVVRSLIEFDDISYDDHAELLYDLSGQLVAHLKTYLKDENEIANVLQYNQKELGRFIHAQMLDHQNDVSTEFEVKITKGFTEINPTAYTVPDNQTELDIHDTTFERSKIKTILFGGFKKSLFPFAKFDSDTERRFAIFLDSKSDKWFKPALGQIQIYYKAGHEEKKYNPDFIAEFSDCILMVETKASNEITSDEVQAKKKAAVQWCAHATMHASQYKGKPWNYLLIPHDEVTDDKTLKYYMQFKE